MRHARPGREKLLFSERATVLDVVEAQRRGLDKALNEVSATEIRRRSIDDLANELVGKFCLDVPVIDQEHIVQFPPEEVDVDVSRDHNRMFITPGPHYVKGTRVSIGVPFAGDSDLFKFPESSFASPIEGEIDEDNHYVVLAYEAEHPDAAAVRREFDSRIERITHSLDMIRGRTKEWNDRLSDLVRSRLTARRAKLERDEGLSLGFAPAEPPRPRDESRRPDRPSAVFGEGEQFDALREFQRIIGQAEQAIVLVDSYVGPTVLESLSGKRRGVKVRLLTKLVNGPLSAAAKAFNAQHGGLSMRTSESFHDRFVIVDGRHFYHFGASIKDAGMRVFRLARIDDPSEQKKLMQEFDAAWSSGSDA